MNAYFKIDDNLHIALIVIYSFLSSPNNVDILLFNLYKHKNGRVTVGKEGGNGSQARPVFLTHRTKDINPTTQLIMLRTISVSI